MPQFIEADVIQKIATPAEWATLLGTKIPYKGQIMLVSDGTGKVINIKVGDGTNNFASLTYMFDTIQANVNYVQVTSTALPTPTITSGFSVVGEGTYTKSGQPDVVVPAGSLGILGWSGNVWSLSQSVVLPTTPVSNTIIEGGTSATSQDAVFKGTYVRPIADVKNSILVTESDIMKGQIDLFKKSYPVIGRIDNTTGIVADPSSTMVAVPVQVLEYYIKANRDAGSAFSAVFKDANGNQLKPAGRSNYTLSFNKEGVFTPPTGAVVFLTNLNIGSTVIMQLTGSILVRSNNKDKKTEIFESLIPDSVKYTQLLNESPNKFDKDSFDVGYINTTTGVLVNNNAAGLASKTSKWLRLDDSIDYVAISGRNGTNGNLRFSIDGSTIIKPIKDDNTEFTNYDPTQNGKGINDVFKKPSVGGVKAKYVSITYVFNITGDGDSVMVVNGSSIPSKYQPFGFTDIKSKYMPTSNNLNLSLSKTGSSYSVSGVNSNNRTFTTNFVTRIGANELNNPNFNLVSDYVNGVLFKNSNDDVAPVNIFDSNDGSGRFIGGNHGWSYAKELTLANHGKTVADVGSVYTDATPRDFVIVRVPDANKIVVVARNIATDGYSYNFPAVSGTLTYKSNGVNTGAISGYSQLSLPNIFNFVKINYSRVLCDGADAVDGITNCAIVQIAENYDVFDLDSVLVQLINNRPSGGYVVNPNLNSFNADILFSHSLVYEWNSPGKCTIYHDFFPYKKLKFNYHSFIQASALSSSTARIYIPRSLPFGSVDYRLAPVYNAPATAVHLTKNNYWELLTKSPIRVMNFIQDNYGIHIGYIRNLADSVNRESLVDDAIYLNTTKKIYPKGVDTNVVIEPGTSYSVVAFRNIVDLTNVGAVRTSYDTAIANGSLYVYLDYHKSGIDVVNIPVNYIGKNITILDSKGVTLQSKISTGSLTLDVKLTDGQGHIDLQIG